MLMLENWKQEETGMAENEMVREYHWLSGHEYEQTLGDRGGQSPWGHKALGTT